MVISDYFFVNTTDSIIAIRIIPMKLKNVLIYPEKMKDHVKIQYVQPNLKF